MPPDTEKELKLKYFPVLIETSLLAPVVFYIPHLELTFFLLESSLLKKACVHFSLALPYHFSLTHNKLVDNPVGKTIGCKNTLLIKKKKNTRFESVI